MSRCFHPHSHADSCLPQIAVELLCFSVTVLESPLTELPRLRIHERNLLNARVVITTYNQHIGSFLPSLGLVGTTQVYSGPGSRHCYEIIIQNDQLKRTSAITGTPTSTAGMTFS